jgi:hypothetical protein
LPANTPLPEKNGRERRSSSRRRKQVQVLFTPAEGLESPSKGWVLDRSLGGFRLSVVQAVALGTRLSVRAANAPAKDPWVEVEVKSCRRQDHRWELGCRFVDEPSYSVLLQFG